MKFTRKNATKNKLIEEKESLSERCAKNQIFRG